jgi:proteasome lid subunit RPN8/RPN11
VLGPTVMAKLVEVTQATRAIEQCGVLAGRVNSLGEATVEASAQLRNVHRRPETNYEFDASDQASAWDQVEAVGLEVLAVWHTHPHGPPYPSGTDLEYMQPWLLYPILMPSIIKRVDMTVYRLRAPMSELDELLERPAEHLRYEVVPYEVRR